ncbi:S100 calcium binding protein A9 [Phyllostomus discolor]|uniref:Protein S100 n=1 Tax=Phyllostomus discolor TaxID=89673 RepID=A0A6J2KWL5_9CHIR|nr:protein S100-A9 isoform X2 [Phyllostomus discolor]KAF6075806.1 S100 calcium binding protein A9 [Phyllostomus discolor]
MPSLMECSINNVIKIFHQYSRQEAHTDRLNQNEFKELVQKELPNFLQKENRNEAAIKEILEDLDTSGDKQLSFEEFAMLVAKLTEAAHEEMHKDGHRGHDHQHGKGFGESRGSCQSQGGQSQGGHSH